jgi:protein SCO1/2
MGMTIRFGTGWRIASTARDRRPGLGRAAHLALLCLLLCAPAAEAPADQAAHQGGSRWGANYFPNIPLITHEGQSVRFFDDLIQDKVVAINFIFTSCPDSCPLETARLANVQRILGDRMGRDVFFYSISIDPENDTPQVLKDYAERYQAGPGWLFLTGDEADITLLRKKLGLYIAEIQGDDSTDHNLSLMIGNQSTGRWMKRSPFENPYVLATQLGSWLHNWKLPSPDQRDYADAPKLRNLSPGEQLFRTRCSACHTIGGGEIIVGSKQQPLGPDLLGVTETREREWLARWLADPDGMLEEKDPIVMGLYARYNNVLMPNMRLNQRDVEDLIEYMEAESARVESRRAKAKPAHKPGHCDEMQQNGKPSVVSVSSTSTP